MYNIKLGKPIKRGDSEITELNLRRPDSGSLRGLAVTDIMRMDVDALADITPRICTEITKAEFMELDPYDIAQVGQELVGFFTSPP